MIDPRDYEVALIETDNEAAAFIQRHHYSGSYPAARCRVGLYRADELVGAAVFSVSCNERVIPSYLPELEPLEGVELGRFVLLDDVPGNGESWFLARAFELLKRAKPEVRGVLSYSDPVPRHDEDGQLILPGHIGTIYQAHNGCYMGRSSPRTLTLDRRGRVISPRTLSKLRRGERGQDYALKTLIEATGTLPERGESAESYIARALAGLRRLKHPGNHAYIWSVDRRLKLAPARQRYPKHIDTAAAHIQGLLF